MRALGLVLALFGSPDLQHRWCAPPVLVRLDDTVPKDLRFEVLAGAFAWNTLGFGVLVRQATAFDDPAQVVTFTWHTDPSILCGLARHSVEDSEPECVSGRLVDLYSLCTLRMREVATHEIGHMLGLEHTTSARDIMYAAMGPGQRITDHDIEELRKRYGSD